jgi:hypothetical protein
MRTALIDRRDTEGNARRARAAMVTHLRNVAAEMLDVVSGRGATGPRRRSRA